MPKCRLFLPRDCPQYQNPSWWTVGRTDERIKWKQYQSASMSANGKSPGYISMPNFMPFPPSDLSANVQKPEKVVKERTDGRTDEQTEGQTSGRSYSYAPLNLIQDKNVFRYEHSKIKNKNHCLWPWPLVYALEKLIRSGHYHYQCMYQIW